MASQATESQLTPPVSEPRDHIQGPPTATVTLVEYADYECPYCGQAHEILVDLSPLLEGRARLVFRNFPLAQIHPHAQRAAEAAEAAGAQGMFWEMHDTLFENQQELDDEALASYAVELGLDLSRFTRELAAGTFAGRVREDFLSGVRSGVNGTPTFFINGRRHDRAWDAESLTLAIEAAAKEPRGLRGGVRTKARR